MKAAGKVLLVSLIACCLAHWPGTFVLYAQEQIKFEHLDSEDGLSENVVYAIHQDHNGYLWIGTWDGLNRYDGYSFKKYYHNSADSSTISGNTINCIYEDKKGGLWIGTNGGLCRYDYNKGNFSRISLRNLAHYNVLHITGINESELLVQTGDTIFLFNSSNFHSRPVSFEKQGRQFYPHINTSFAKDKDGEIIICYPALPDLQVYKYQEQDHMFKPLVVNVTGLPSQYKKISTQHYTSDTKGQRWFATDKEKLLVFDHAGNFLPINHHPLLQKKFTVQCFYNSPSGDVWIGTEQGLLQYEAATGELYWYTGSLAEPSLSSPVINCVFTDKTGVVWVGTFNGLNKLVPVQKKFKHITTSQGLLSNFIMGIYEESWDQIRIHYNLGVREFSRFIFSGSLSRHYSKADYPGADYLQQVVIQQSQRLQPVSANEYKKVFFENNQNRFFPPRLIADDSQRIWYSEFLIFGCFSPGPAKKYIKDTLAFFKGEIYDMQMQQDEIWLATATEGLVCYSIKNKKLKKYMSDPSQSSGISSNEVLCLLANDEGLWVGTKGGGLNYFNRQKEEFIHYSTEQGLCNNSIYSIVSDEQGNLWLGTSNGLSRFDVKKKTFRNYFRSDGLINSEFNRYSALRTGDGRLFFGGMNGIDYFYPEDLIDNNQPPQLLITDVKIFNQSIDRSKPISLSHKNNYISFEFAAIDFQNPAANKFAYKLEGADKDWVYVENRNFVSYPTLQPGHYRFFLKGSNSDGVWNENPVTIAFTIRNPWWRTIWFYGSCIVALATLLYALYSFRIRQLKKMMTLRTKISQDLHDEVGATLTSISYLSEVAKQQSAGNGKATTSMLDQIGEYSRTMITEMNDIVWVINPANDKFDKIVDRMENFALPLLASRNIKWKFAANEEIKNISLSMQQRKSLYLIFKEAINNVAKYSDARVVQVLLKKANDILLLEIRDDGKGFELNGSSQGNGLQNMQSRAIETGGKLQISSSPGKGTCLVLEMPITQNTY